MLFIRFPVILTLLFGHLIASTFGLSRSVAFPLTERYNAATDQALADAFKDMVDSTDFFEQCHKYPDECLVPAFGADARIKFGANTNRKTMLTHKDPTEFLLTVEGVKGSDFGWICTKLYECKKSFHDMLDMNKLTTIVEGHFDEKPPEAISAGQEAMEVMFQDESILSRLSSTGFVVVNTAPKTTLAATNKLSELLVDKTKQHDSIRRDNVRHLEKDDLDECGLGKQYDFLMSIAGHMNEKNKMKPSGLRPLYPATKLEPLTNPRSIQAAEFSKGEFYVAHSDNSETSPNNRRSFRHYTCIMYLNDDWKECDGGALRIYPFRADPEDEIPQDAHVQEIHSHVDILPHNGRLVIFDSTLVHSVEPVTHSDKLRRALTLWINKPEDVGTFQ